MIATVRPHALATLLLLIVAAMIHAQPAPLDQDDAVIVAGFITSTASPNGRWYSFFDG